LRAWSDQITGSLRGIFVVHGEIEPATAFADVLRQRHPTADIRIPAYADSVEI